MEFKKVEKVEEAMSIISNLFRGACKVNDTFHIMLPVSKDNRGLADEITAALEEAYSKELYKGSMTYEVHPLAKGVEVAYQNLDEQGLLIKKYYGEDFKGLTAGQLNALCEALGNTENDIKGAFKAGFLIWTLEEYKEELKESGLNEEEIEEEISNVDVTDGYIIERF